MAAIDVMRSGADGDPADAGPRRRPSSAPDRTARASSGPRVATICQVLHSLEVGGAEVLAARLARGLSRVYRFLFVCLDELGSLGQELRDEAFPIEVLGRRSGVDWRCARRLAEIVRR